MAKKISIVIPAYNAEATIEATVNSVLKQKCRSEIEVIVGDDASKDSTREIVGRLPARLVALEKNSGAGTARNRGAAKASGEILVFLDADVYLEPGSLQIIEQFFDRHPEYSAAVGNYAVIPVDKDICSFYHNFLTLYHHDLLGKDVEWLWGALSAVRKEDFDRLRGFSEAYPGASVEDLELGYRLSEAGKKIRYLDELRGVHARKFTLGKMLYNDYHKAVLGVKLYWKMNRSGRHRHGFSSAKNGLNVALCGLGWPALLALFIGIPWPLIVLLALFGWLNFNFYRYIWKRSGALYLIASVPLHWVCFNTIAAGVAAGIAGLVLGKGLESKSRWI